MCNTVVAIKLRAEFLSIAFLGVTRSSPIALSVLLSWHLLASTYQVDSKLSFFIFVRLYYDVILKSTDVFGSYNRSADSPKIVILDWIFHRSLQFISMIFCKLSKLHGKYCCGEKGRGGPLAYGYVHKFNTRT